MFYVEHYIFKNKLLIIIFLGLSVVSCKKELPNPELLDPIYKDLLSETKSVRSELKDSKANLETLLKERETVKVRTLAKTVNQRDTIKTRKNILRLKQRLKYLEIRTERRRVETRRSYKIAFSKGEAWPDKEEYKHYRTNRRLRAAPRNWNSRVPKLHARNPNFKEKK